MQPEGVAISRFSKVTCVARYLNELNVSLICSDPIHVNHRFAEPGDTVQRSTPVGDRAEIIDELSQGLLHLNEGADSHHQRPEG